MSSTYNQAGNRYELGQYEDLSVERFVLDSSTLDTNGIGLDGPSPAFILDTSTLDGDAKLDGFLFTTTATGASSLGGLAASATGTITHIVTAVATAPLGGLSASATATIDNPASGDAPLGGLTSAADANVTVPASASATLGGIASSATGAISVVATAVGNLGSVVAAATGTVTPLGTMTANLGGLDATATGTVTPVTPAVQPGGAPYPYRRQKPRKKTESIVEVSESETVVVPVKIVEAYCTPIVASVSAVASGSVTFVAEDDDLQVILML